MEPANRANNVYVLNFLIVLLFETLTVERVRVAQMDYRNTYTYNATIIEYCLKRDKVCFSYHVVFFSFE